MVWALRELHQNRQAEWQGGLEQRPPDEGTNPAAMQEPHRARTRTHPCPFCYSRKQDILAIALW